MKILLLAPQPFYQPRGTPIAVDLVLRTLSARGDEVDVLTYHAGEPVRYPGVQLHRIPRLRLVRHVGPGFSLKKCVCDVVFFFAALRMAARGGYELVHAVEESVFAALAIKRRFKIPYLYDMDSLLSEQMIRDWPVLAPVGRWLRVCEGVAIRQADVVMPVCEALAQTAAAYHPRKTVILPDVSLLSLDGHAATPQRSVKDKRGLGGPIVMYMGNLERYQGIDLLLRSFAMARRRIPTAQLVIVGGRVSHIHRYQRQAGRLGLDGCVRFLGQRPVDALGSYLDAADVLVSPRLGGINVPMKIYSYLDSGKPILATDLLVHTQVLTPHVALLRSPTPDAFAEGMVRLVRDADLRRRLGQAGRTLVKQRYSYQAFYATLNALYEELEDSVASCRGGEAMPPSLIPQAARPGPSPGNGRARGSTRMLWVRVGVSVALLWWLASLVNWQEVAQIVRACRWRWVLVALGCSCMQRTLTVLRWQILLRAIGIRSPLTVLFRSVWTSGFFEGFLPTTAGADGVRIYSFSRFSGRPLEVFSSVAMERVLGALALALLATASACWAWGMWGRREISALIIVPVLVIVAASLLLWHPLVKRGSAWMLDRLTWLPGRRWLSNAYESLFAYREHPGALLTVLLFSIIIHLVRVLLVLAAGFALNLPVGLEQVLVVAPAILLFSMLPISVGQWGVREGAFVYLFGLTGIAAGPALMWSLLTRAVMTIGDLPGLWFFLADGLAHPRHSHPVPRRPVASEVVSS